MARPSAHRLFTTLAAALVLLPDEAAASSQPSSSSSSKRSFSQYGRLAKRRTNFTEHSPEQLAYLQHFNEHVGHYLWIGLAIMIGVVTLLNWLAKLQSFLRRREAGFRSSSKRLPRVKTRERDDNGQIVIEERHSVSLRFFWYWLSAFWRKYSIKHNGLAEFFFLGDLGQLFLLSVYLLLNFLLILLGTENDVDWMAHHAAKLTYANLPLIIGLAGKNNVLSRLTGFAYESLNVLHRWSARFVIISSAIHIGGRIHVNVPSSDPGPGRRYIAWGWAAFALFLYMIFAASRSFRNRYYQFFLVQHVTCWFLIVACLVIHRPQEQGWIWAGFALHGLDRIARGARILYYHALKKTTNSEENPQGTVQAVGDDTIRVTVRTRQNWIPGQHVFLHCPEESLGGHPFTISNISRPLDQMDDKRPDEAKQELLIRVREGLTKHLFEKATSAGDDETAVDGKGFPRESVPIRAWTEGPYGHEKYLGEDHNTLLLVAGGSGVSYTLSNSLNIVRRAQAMYLGSECKTIAVATKRLHFLWMVKKPEQVEWIADHLRGMCLASPPGFLQITIFITGKRKANEPAVMEGFVTDDQRDDPPSPSSSSDDDEKKGEKSKEDKRAIDDHGHHLTKKEKDAKLTKSKSKPAQPSEKAPSSPPPRAPSPDRELSARASSELHPRGEKHIPAPTDQNASSPVSLPITDGAPPPQSQSSTASSRSPGTTTKQVSHGATVVLRSGRPDFGEIVEKEVGETAYEDWIAIGACGPTPMNDSLADAVSAAVKPMSVLRGEVRRNIYLTIEEFGW